MARKVIVDDSFIAGLFEFHEGDVLIYLNGGYSRYDDCYIYEFKSENGDIKFICSDRELNIEEDLKKLNPNLSFIE